MDASGKNKSKVNLFKSMKDPNLAVQQSGTYVIIKDVNPKVCICLSLFLNGLLFRKFLFYKYFFQDINHFI